SWCGQPAAVRHNRELSACRSKRLLRCPLARRPGRYLEHARAARDVLGTHHFDELQAHLGIARNVLAARLCRLVANDILTRRQFGRTAGEYFARWHWVLKLLAAMPQPGTSLWNEWLTKRANALRGWDTSGTPPKCPRCRRLAQVLFVPDTGDNPLCGTCWLEANGKTSTTGDRRDYAIVTAERSP